MSSVNQGATLIALATLLDLYNKRSHLTLLFSGTQGIGKSESLYLAAEKVNGFAATIDGSVLNDGELPGIPFRKKSGKARVWSFDSLRMSPCSDADIFLMVIIRQTPQSYSFPKTARTVLTIVRSSRKNEKRSMELRFHTIFPGSTCSI